MKRVCLSILAGAVLLSACGGNDDQATPTQAASTSVPGSASTAATAPASTTKAGLDTTFGNGGIAQVPLSTSEHDRFMAVTVAKDGSIYAAGYVTQGGDQAMALAKYSAAGVLDKSFGKDGVAVVNVASGGKTAEVARAVAISANGKILIAGPIEHDTSATGDGAKDTDVAVLRFDTSGKLDTTFGREGIARIDFGAGKATSATTFVGDTVWGMGALPGDRVAMFGTRHAGGERPDGDYVLAGLTSAGVLDTAFGQNGMTVVDVSAVSDNPRHLIVDKDGTIVASGYSTIDGVVQPVLVRASAAGQIDRSFGTNGVATARVLPGVAEAYSVAKQGDAYIAAGYGRGADTAEKVDLIVYRFTSSGQWDKSFGSEGVARLDLAKEDDRSRNVAVLPDGRILAVGSGKMTAANIDAMATLWSKDGKAESAFGTSGRVLSDLGGPADAWFGVAVSPDGKSVVVGGYKGTDANSGGNDDAVLAKFSI